MISAQMHNEGKPINGRRFSEGEKNTCAMKLLIRILAILTLSPIIRGLGNTLMTTDMPDICKNESLNLFMADRITLHRGFIASSFLRCIRITAPTIETAEGSFDNVPNLMYLDLAQNDNRPSDLFSFGDLPNVRILSLGGDRYFSSYGEEAVVRYVYPSLEYLDLRNSKISIISNLKESFPNLTHLDLSGNRIEQSTLWLLPNTLMHLDVSDNALSSVHLSDKPNLLSLRLDNNKIGSISYYSVVFTGLEKLVNLSIANNRIREISERKFENMVNLRYLNLAGNQLSFPYLNATAYLPSLETLILDSNSFENVPLIASLNITTLSLNCNRIANLTANSFFNLPYLKRLHLSGNTVESVHVDAFKDLKLLEELHLDGNLLSYLPALWCQYTGNLRYLNLAGNKFTSLESAIYSRTLPMLELHLEGNPIACINSIVAQMIPENMIVYLNGDFQSSGKLCKSSRNEGIDSSEWPTKYPSWMLSVYSWGN